MDVSFVLAGALLVASLACVLLVLLDPGVLVRLRERRHGGWRVSKRHRVG